MIIAERGGDGAAVLIVFESRLDVVIAVSGRLETVNSHDLVFGQSGRSGSFGIGAFELTVILRQSRAELELLLRGGKKIGDDRHIDRMRRRLRLDGLRGFGGPL